MSAWTKFKRLCSKDWFLALVLLGVYLATNRYIYAWDDQHLEIPLLKHLIDPELYKGDYYVESLAQNFTSYLYPILSKFITVDQIPSAYLILFLLSRYFLFYWSFKLWDLLARKYFGSGADLSASPRFSAFCAVTMSILIGRTEEFLYRTFSHQEFALAIIFAAIYFFFKERFVLAAVLFGIAADFHALYALFPMTYMSLYLLFFHPQRRVGNFIKTGFAFVAACSPFLLWAIPKNIQLHMLMPSNLTENWVEMYYLACPQNFPFGADKLPQVFADIKILTLDLAPFLLMIVLYAFHTIFNPPFRQDKKIRAIAIAVAAYVAACFYFSYVHPMRLALDLNLIRNEQFLRYFFMGYTTIFLVYKTRQTGPWTALLLSFMFMFLWYRGPFGGFVITTGILLLTAVEWKDLIKTWDRNKLLALVILLLAIDVFMFAGVNWPKIRMDKITANAAMLIMLLGYAMAEISMKGKLNKRGVFVGVPLIIAFFFFCYYHYQYVQVTTKGGGFWQLQRNWEDMQHYVKDHTPKDALILEPYNTEMGGFRIGSERKVVVSYRDCGIVGFDYQAALEWRQRVKDIEPFKVFTDPKSIGPAIVNALYKYKVDYIVFMRYYAPEDNALIQKMYENEVFSFYKVIINRD
jgi:hypothetical protein